ncbi:MAG: hypothetical protein ACOCRK_07405 [bacterium]
MSITIINLSKDITELPNTIKNWDQLPSKTQNKLLTNTDFRIYNYGQEVLIYNNNKAKYSCSSKYNYNNELEINTIYDNNGLVWSL